MWPSSRVRARSVRRSTPHRTGLRLAAFAVVGASVAAACSSGESALEIDSGGDATTTVAPDGTTDITTDASTPDETALASTTTVAPLAQFPECPTGALDSAAGPVEITFWHGMNDVLEDSLIELTDTYNASQDRVNVTLQNQTSYDAAIDKYIQSSPDSRPDMIQVPEYALQAFAQSDTLIPVGACVEDSGFDTSPFLDRAIDAYTWQGVQWAMPFNVSNPVLYYLRPKFEAAGLDPDVSPITLEDLRSASQQIVDSDAATYGWVLDSGTNSGGGWFLEQWFARADEPYADNDNGRSAPATEVLFDSPTGTELMTYLQDMINDGLAVSVGDNTGGQDTFLKLIDPAADGAMTIGSSASLAGVLGAIGGGLAPGLTAADVGIGPMPGPSPEPGVNLGGASLWIVDGKGDERAAATWDYITYLIDAEVQSQWASQTGYVPVRSDALDLEPLLTTYAEDPRFRVAYDQMVGDVESDTSLAPVVGPQREVRVATANATAAILNGADVAAALADAAAQANTLITSYNQRN
ncbi:MAG TPA: ABC transporter substrate-binding protein [Ilumatobacteraceae bacterium]|nr:ABC transporter substrate-binding protein [Ilumatobacteraceae bacterium]